MLCDMSAAAEMSDVLAAAQARADLQSGRAREIRKRAGLTQADVARACGVGQPTVASWEAGRRVPPTKYAVKLAELLWQLDRLTREA